MVMSIEESLTDLPAPNLPETLTLKVRKAIFHGRTFATS